MTTTATAPTNPRTARFERPARRRTAIALAVGFFIVVAFQIALTLGAPFGAAALGGVNTGTLPAELRPVTAVSALVWIFAAFIVLARGGVSVIPLPRGLYRWGTWVLVGYLALGVLMNVASSSPWERFGWAPFTVVLFTLTLLLALGGFGGTRGKKPLSQP